MARDALLWMNFREVQSLMIHLKPHITMERKIALSDLQNAVDEAYEQYKSLNEGSVDEILGNVDDKLFGISVVLTDGTVVNKGDTSAPSPLGRIALLPTHVELLTQITPDELIKKASAGRCCGEKKQKPRGLAVSPHGVRAVSAVEPTGDSDGKWDIMVNNLISLVGSEPVLDDKLYERMTKRNADENVIDALAQAEYALYDQADIAVDLYTRMAAMTLTTVQLATMGATVAADGVNPLTNQAVFDGNVAANVVATLARGVHKGGRAWMMAVGLPAANSFGGAILAVLPGFGAIAAYAPALDAKGVSAKAAAAICSIARKLQLNVFSSARVSVEK